MKITTHGTPAAAGRIIGTREITVKHHLPPVDRRKITDTRKWFRELPWDPDTRAALDDAEVCLSELLTNSAVHSYSKTYGHPIHVTCVDTGTAVRVEVIDSPGPWERAREWPTDVHSEHGRGLLLVEALAVSWSSVIDDHGRCTWCEVAYAPK